MQDWNDSNILSERANEAIQIANRYHKTRRQWADAKLLLDMELALKYKDGSIPESIAYEKALIKLLINNPLDYIQKAYEDYIQLEAEYKGLEKVLDAHQNRISLAQSLIKNSIRNT